MRMAAVRELSPRFAECELTHLPRQPIDLAQARRQHAGYAQALAELGLQVVPIPGADDHPDGVFVEDTALILDETAVLTLPGAASRQGEVDSVAEVLGRYRPLRRLADPARADGGDLLRVGRQVFVGLSSRTNETAAAQLATLLSPYGYRVGTLQVIGCLHLKSAVTWLGEETVVGNPRWLDPALLPGIRFLEVDPSEPAAGNTLTEGGITLLPSSFPRTRERLERAGYATRTVEVSELLKAESGVTCSSLVFEV